MLPIDRLPTELLSRAIGYLKLNGILRVARSNRRWRHVALNHPKFWRDVVVDEFGDMSLALTKARIAAARRRPLHLDFVHRHQGSRAERILIDIVGPVISHVRILRVTVNSLYIMTLWRVLMHESPLLEQLEVTLHLDDNAHLVEVKNIALPSRVLAGNAPRLRRVALENVFVAYDTPPVLHNVTEFRFTLPEGTYLSFPRWIFSDLPTLAGVWLPA
ncbi:hypothetical protein EXIGLDRAFT_778193 [Exidia glandulosa HHB12029]|uniref:F-box domain-containing protein n=1 Tax=Exidia glandulosa HHB12029 TaxID=1314781 RepID=A0A165CN58_EXIGL|nr:hypothetical protein EXIGLDRAFT_778193 [Exidia glandulosa HHB12029]